MANADAPTPVVVQPVDGRLPDQYRATVRTGAQAFAGVVVALLAKAVADRLGVDLPVEVTGPLGDALAAAVVAIAAIVWMTVVTVVSRRFPGVERLFILKGQPVYTAPGSPPIR